MKKNSDKTETQDICFKMPLTNEELGKKSFSKKKLKDFDKRRLDLQQKISDMMWEEKGLSEAFYTLQDKAYRPSCMQNCRCMPTFMVSDDAFKVYSKTMHEINAKLTAKQEAIKKLKDELDVVHRFDAACPTPGFMVTENDIEKVFKIICDNCMQDETCKKVLDACGKKALGIMYLDFKRVVHARQKYVVVGCRELTIKKILDALWGSGELQMVHNFYNLWFYCNGLEEQADEFHKPKGR